MRHEHFNLSQRSFKEAIVEAKRLSKLTNTEIANMSGIQEAKVARYFSLYDKYMPSPENIPALCRALGNTLIAEWVIAQVQEAKSKTEVSISGLTNSVRSYTESTWEINALVMEAVEEGLLPPQKAQDIQTQLFNNGRLNFKVAEALDSISRGEVRQ